MFIRLHSPLFAPEGESGASAPSTSSEIFGGSEPSSSTPPTGDVAAPATRPTVSAPAGSGATAPTQQARPTDVGAPGSVSTPAQTSPTSDSASTNGAAAPNQPPVPQVMSPEQMAELAAQTAARVAQAQLPPQQQQAPQYTQEDFNKAFNIPTVTPDVFQAITGYPPDKPEQVAALQNFATGIIRAAATISNYQLEQARQLVTSQIEPLTAANKAQLDSQLNNEFYSSNAHLKDFDPLVKEVVKSFKAEGRQFATKAELFKNVAERVHTLLGKAVPQINQTHSNGSQPAANGSQRQMTPTAVGGQVSAGFSSATKANDAQVVFG